MPADQHRNLCGQTNLLPVRRLFERRWDWRLAPRASRVQKLSAFATEINTRLTLPNDFLYKVDTASMKESLEVRVPMLDEDLFEFAISLPYEVNVKGRTCKRVLREIAKRRLPFQVAMKPKQGFGIPLDSWVDRGFRTQLRESILGASSYLPEFFRPEFYRPRIEAFCDGRQYPGAPREFMYQLAIMLLSIQLTLESVARVNTARVASRAAL
jgi:asparagine synthase (glutamine-hydrolysing)